MSLLVACKVSTCRVAESIAAWNPREGIVEWRVRVHRGWKRAWCSYLGWRTAPSYGSISLFHRIVCMAACCRFQFVVIKAEAYELESPDSVREADAAIDVAS